MYWAVPYGIALSCLLAILMPLSSESDNPLEAASINVIQSGTNELAQNSRRDELRTNIDIIREYSCFQRFIF